MSKRITIPGHPLYIGEEPYYVMPSLAMKVGLNEAIFVGALHRLCIRHGQEYGDRLWVQTPIREWQERMPWWSTDTIRRTIGSLHEQGLIATARFETSKGQERAKWYTIEYESPLLHADHRHIRNMLQPHSASIPMKPLESGGFLKKDKHPDNAESANGVDEAMT